MGHARGKIGQRPAEQLPDLVLEVAGNIENRIARFPRARAAFDVRLDFEHARSPVELAEIFYRSELETLNSRGGGLVVPNRELRLVIAPKCTLDERRLVLDYLFRGHRLERLPDRDRLQQLKVGFPREKIRELQPYSAVGFGGLGFELDDAPVEELLVGAKSQTHL